MDKMTEHNLKMSFIESMLNKYDYLPFKQFCIDSGFEVMSFMTYANLIEPYVYQPEQSKGLGDTIAKITHATGLDQLATLYTNITGQPCGCQSRQEALNKLVPYGVTENG